MSENLPILGHGSRDVLWEHGVAHFHAAYGVRDVSIEVLETGEIREFPPRALGWCLISTGKLQPAHAA